MSEATVLILSHCIVNSDCVDFELKIKLVDKGLWGCSHSGGGKGNYSSNET